MRVFFLIIAALITGAAHAAGMVYQSGDLIVRISSDACQSEALAEFIGRQVPGKVGAAVVTYKGQEYMACWAPIPDAVVIVDESGDGGFLPLSEFKPAG